jgi:hypothetical protein
MFFVGSSCLLMDDVSFLESDILIDVTGTFSAVGLRSALLQTLEAFGL